MVAFWKKRNNLDMITPASGISDAGVVVYEIEPRSNKGAAKKNAAILITLLFAPSFLQGSGEDILPRPRS